MVAFCYPKRLRNVTVPAKLENKIIDKDCHKCGSIRSEVCDYIPEDTKFASKDEGPEYILNRNYR